MGSLAMSVTYMYYPCSVWVERHGRSELWVGAVKRRLGIHGIQCSGPHKNIMMEEIRSVQS